MFSSFSKWPKWLSASLINQWEHLYSVSYHSPEQIDTTLGGSCVGGGGGRTSVSSPWTTILAESWMV